MPIFKITDPWNQQRPHVLVVACSDGRLQAPLDEFLSQSLGISSYDRLYVPGGPGALAPSGLTYLRADQIKDELQFLIEAHQIEEVILIYHAAAEDGPMDGNCADYRRIYPYFDSEGIRQQQAKDTEQILMGPLKDFPAERVRAFRFEITGDHRINVKRLL